MLCALRCTRVRVRAPECAHIRVSLCTCLHSGVCPEICTRVFVRAEAVTKLCRWQVPLSGRPLRQRGGFVLQTPTADRAATRSSCRREGSLVSGETAERAGTSCAHPLPQEGAAHTAPPHHRDPRQGKLGPEGSPSPLHGATVGGCP